MKVVFVINSLTHYHIFYDYIKKLNDLQSYEIFTVLVNSELISKEKNLSSISNVIKIFDPQLEVMNKNKENKANKKSKRTFFFFIIFYFIYLFWKHFKIYKKCKKIFNSIQPDFVFISSDRYTTFDLFFAKYCNKNKVKVAVLGIDYFYVETFESYLKSNPSRKISTTSQKLTSLIFPKQVFFVNDVKCLYYPPHLIWNLFFINALPSQPYLTGSRFVDQIHVDSEFTKKKYIEYGVNEKLIRVVGLLEHDLIYSSCQRKEAIKLNFKLDPIRKTVVLAVPQGFEHHLIGKEAHFEIINKLILKILEHPVNLILSLHPKMDFNNYSFLEEKYQLQISRYSLREFIVISDLFIATYSSTVLWSSILNIPCIVFDLYDLNYTCYEELRNVKRTKGFVEFEDALKLIMSDLHTNKDSKPSDSQFGLLDNKVFERFLKNLNEN